MTEQLGDTFRVRYEAIICCMAEPEDLRKAAARLVEILSKSFGGASSQQVTGGWAVNGNDESPPYHTIKSEPGFKIYLTVPLKDATEGYEMLARTIAEVVHEYKLPARFIHVDRQHTEAMHFDIMTGQSCGITEA